MSWLDSITPASKSDIKRLENRMNEQQTKIDTLTATVQAQTKSLAGVKAQLGTVNTGIDGLDAQVTDLAKEVAGLKAAQQAGEPLDLSKLESAVSDIQVTITGVQDAASMAAANIASPPDVQPAV